MTESLDVPRIQPQEVWAKLQGGSPFHLVCAYLDPDKCARFALAGSISFVRLQGLLPEMSKDTPLVFYCA